MIVNEYFRPRDLKSFDKEYKIPEQTIENFVGTFKPIAQTEASLDIQYITAIGQDVPTWWVRRIKKLFFLHFIVLHVQHDLHNHLDLYN